MEVTLVLSKVTYHEFESSEQQKTAIFTGDFESNQSFVLN